MALAIDNSPIVRDSANTRRDRSPYATAAGDRNKHCRSVAPWPNRNQSYDPEIVRFGLTVALVIIPAIAYTHKTHYTYSPLLPSIILRTVTPEVVLLLQGF